MALPPCGNRMPSHRIHSYCVYSPTDFHSSGGILPPPQQRVSHRIRRSHRSLCWEYSPADFTDLHRWLGCVDSSGGILASAAAKCLPQISLLLRIFSHRFHRIHRNSCWGDSPTDFTDQHRWLGCVYSPTDFTEFTEVRVHPLKLAASEFRGGLFSFVLFVLFVFVSSQASGSVNSVNSVGEPTHPTNLCQSVQSVGWSFALKPSV